MAAVGLGAEDVATYLPENVVVACENSPQSTTISGMKKDVEQALLNIAERKPGTFGRLLEVNMAYHSGMTTIKAFLLVPLLTWICCEQTT